MKKSIVFYNAWGELISNLPDEIAGALIKMICNYSFTGKVEPSGDNVVDAMFLMVKTKLDEDAEAYEEVVKRRSEAGKKGMQKRWGDNKTITNDNTVIANDNTVKNGITNITDNDNDNVNDNKYIYTCADEPHDRKSEEQKLKDNFETLYKYYPKKVGKAKAFEYYRGWVSKNGRLVNGSRTHLENEQMYKAIKRYVQQQEDSNTELQYYKGFDTFMSKAILDYVEG